MYSTSNSAQSVFFFEGPPDKTFQCKIPPWIPGDELNVTITFTPGKLVDHVNLSVMSCHVMSCHVMSSHVMSCHVMSCHVMSSHVMSCHVMSCHVMSCLVMLCGLVWCVNVM